MFAVKAIVVAAAPGSCEYMSNLNLILPSGASATFALRFLNMKPPSPFGFPVAASSTMLQPVPFRVATSVSTLPSKSSEQITLGSGLSTYLISRLS